VYVYVYVYVCVYVFVWNQMNAPPYSEQHKIHQANYITSSSVTTRALTVSSSATPYMIGILQFVIISFKKLTLIYTFIYLINSSSFLLLLNES
jgi:hypothetical protein